MAGLPRNQRDGVSRVRAPKPCHTCRRPILVVRRAENSIRFMPVDAAVQDPVRVRDTSTIRVLRGDRGYSVSHLRDVLSMDLAFDRSRPQSVDDFPWHTVHACEGGRA